MLFFLKDNKKEFILWLNVPKVTAYKCFGYGLVIPHYGTIVVGEDNRCGNYCVLHTSICISGERGGKRIGDALYASSGCRINKPITLGNNV